MDAEVLHRDTQATAEVKSTLELGELQMQEDEAIKDGVGSLSLRCDARGFLTALNGDESRVIYSCARASQLHLRTNPASGGLRFLYCCHYFLKISQIFYLLFVFFYILLSAISG